VHGTQYPFLRRGVGIDTNVRGGRALMTEPERDQRRTDAGRVHANGGGVSKCVRQGSPTRKVGTAGGGELAGKLESIGHGRLGSVPT